jgi:hypothetical protein
MAAARGVAVPVASSWGRAIEVPGLGALNKGGNAGVREVSCTSPGTCAAGGDYTDSHRHEQGFVAVERHGVWGRATEVPGLGALNMGGKANVNSVSCASAGNCAAVGAYADSGRHEQGFAVIEKNGVWGQAAGVPGLAALNKGGSAGISEVSCPSAGNCTAGGSYTDGAGHDQGFVAVERHGVWGQATRVPGLAALNEDADSYVLSVSCASARNCAAVGDYTDSSGGQGFAAVEKNGQWGNAIEVPGLAALNTGGDADVFSVSCASPGSNCAAVGDYTDSGDNSQGFVAVEKNGQWGNAAEPPGLAALNGQSGGGNAYVSSVSCASAGNCAAVGTYGWPYGAGFVSVEKNGVWGQVTDLGLYGRTAGANSVSCASPGNCAAGGFYSDETGAIDQGWVAAEQHGRWRTGTEVPGLGALNKGKSADVSTVSCAPAGGCAAGGEYADGHGHQQGFVVTEK